MRHNQAQFRELLTQYGPIDLLFLDGEPAGLKELAWQLQPDIVIIRGQMQTPEERLPGQPLPGAWEGCFPMGTQWQYKPTNERYRTEVSVLGECGRELEYRPDVNPQSTRRNTPQGLQVSAMRTKRVYNEYDWPNPVVLKVTHVEPVGRKP